MITTVFYDLTIGQYNFIASFAYNVPCVRGEHVDFGEYHPFSDSDIFIVENIIHLPHEAKKIVEVRLTIKEQDPVKRIRYQS